MEGTFCDRRVGEDRRANSGCPLHPGVDRAFEAGEKRMENIEKKLDEMISRQIEYIKSIEYIKYALDNGLRSEIKATMESVSCLRDEITTMNNEFNKRIQPLEDFSWFRTWITSVRNNIFKFTLQLAFFGGVIYLIIHYGSKTLDKVLGVG